MLFVYENPNEVGLLRLALSRCQSLLPSTHGRSATMLKPCAGAAAVSQAGMQWSGRTFRLTQNKSDLYVPLGMALRMNPKEGSLKKERASFLHPERAAIGLGIRFPNTKNEHSHGSILETRSGCWSVLSSSSQVPAVFQDEWRWPMRSDSSFCCWCSFS